MSKKNNGKDDGSKRSHIREVNRAKKANSREHWNLMAKSAGGSGGGGGGGARGITLSQR
jgi:hypothetical protein